MLGMIIKHEGHKGIHQVRKGMMKVTIIEAVFRKIQDCILMDFKVGAPEHL